MSFPSLSSSGQGVVPGSPAAVYKSLIDYGSWSEWVPSVSSSRLLAKEDTLAIVELGLDVRGAQTLMFEFIQTSKTALLGRVIEGDVPLREMQWNVEADGGNAKVTFSVKRHLWRYLTSPAYWSFLNPSRWVGGLQSSASVAEPGPEVLSSGENLFELWETETGLMCWIKGRKYVLRPADGK